MTAAPMASRALHPVLLANAIASAEQAREISLQKVEWFWSCIIASRAVTELAGESGVGKSTLVIALAVAASAPPGHPVTLLGRVVEPIPEGKSAIAVVAENGDMSAVQQAERAIQAFGLDREYVWTRLVIIPRKADVRARAFEGSMKEAADDGDVWAAILESLEADAVRFLGLDTRAAIFGTLGLDPNGEEQAELSGRLRRLAEVGNCQIVVTSHLRKSPGAYDVTAVSGSAQRAAGADVVLIMQATREKGRVLSSMVTMAKNRDLIEDSGFACSFALRRNDETQRWAIVIDGDVMDGRSPKERVVAALRDGGEPMTTREVRMAANVSFATAKKLLGELDRAKRVLCIGSKWEFLPELFGGEEKQ